ncbi:MAG: hypothetical protein R8G01_16470 [Ilumatobacteraceae bacterium]|nr:hypothetical protein [Ilumatobacteraceae bacterium]
MNSAVLSATGCIDATPVPESTSDCVSRTNDDMAGAFADAMNPTTSPGGRLQ